MKGISCILQERSDEYFYMFTGSGVFRVKFSGNDDEYAEIFAATCGAQANIPCFVDSNETVRDPHKIFFGLDYKRCFTIIHAASLCIENHRNWPKRMVHSYFYIEPWSWEETYAAG